MFCGSKSSAGSSGVCCVIFVQQPERRDGGGFIERQKVCCTGCCGGLHAFLTPHREVTDSSFFRDAANSFVIPLMHNLPEPISDIGRCHHVPQGTLHRGFDVIDKPRKIRIGVCNLDHRNMNWNFGSFRQCSNIQREITKVMQLLEPFKIFSVCKPASKQATHCVRIRPDCFLKQ